MEWMELLVLLDQRQQLALATSQQVNLVEDEANLGRRMLQHLEGKLIALIELAGRVHDQENNVAAFQGLTHLDHHLAAQRAVWLVHAWSVDQHDLRGVAAFAFGQIDDALNSIARGLRLGRDDREFFAYERIEQRGLASVGAAEDADKTGAERHKEASSY